MFFWNPFNRKVSFHLFFPVMCTIDFSAQNVLTYHVSYTLALIYDWPFSTTQIFNWTFERKTNYIKLKLVFIWKECLPFSRLNRSPANSRQNKYNMRILKGTRIITEGEKGRWNGKEMNKVVRNYTFSIGISRLFSSFI